MRSRQTAAAGERCCATMRSIHAARGGLRLLERSTGSPTSSTTTAPPGAIRSALKSRVKRWSRVTVYGAPIASTGSPTAVAIIDYKTGAPPT
jgi:hypothetical protein